MAGQPQILIVEARFYEDIADMLAEGAVKALEAAGAGYERLSVPGALEIPAAIKFATLSRKYDAFVALGCVIRGETAHYDIVCNESARGLTDLALRHDLAIGNGILTCENNEQAIVRADPAQKNKGAGAAEAALAMAAIKSRFQGNGA